MRQEDNINLIAIFHNFYRYKWSVLGILISIVVLTFFYTKQLTPIYSSHILIDIENYQKSEINSLFRNNINTNIDKEALSNHEVEILKSRYIISKTLDKIDLSKRFFIQKRWRDQEIYKEQIPFNLKFKNLSLKKDSFDFILEEIDKENFKLIIQNSDRKTKDIKRYKYGKLIQKQNYELNITKKTPQKSLVGIKYKIKIETDRDKLITQILNNLSIQQSAYGLLSIDYEDNIPQRAKDILNQLILSYKEYDLKAKQMKDVKNIEFLNKMIIGLEQNLKMIGDKIKNYKLKHEELLIVGSEDKIFINTIEKKNKLNLLSLKLNALKITKKRIENGIYSISLLQNSNLNTTDINHLIEKLREKNRYLKLLYQQQNNPYTTIIDSLTYTNLLKKFKDSKEKLLELRVEYTSSYPEVKKIKKDINLFREELTNYLQNSIDKSNREIKNLKNEIFNTIDILIKSINKEFAYIKSSLQRDKMEIEKLPNSTIKLEELERVFKVNKNNYEKLLQKRSESLISKESTFSNIKIVDKATLPTYPIKPKKSFILLSSLIVGIIISILYTSIRVSGDKAIHSKYDIKADNYFLIYGKENIEKKFWRLITYLEKIVSSKKSQIILVSSSDYGENKSIVTNKLAIKLSTIGKKTIMIDFDVYYQSLTKGLEQNSSMGLSTLLTSKHSFDEMDINSYIKPIKKYQNIEMLPSGPIIPNGSALLFHSKISPLIDTLSKEYDYILIDTPPIGKYPEIDILLKYVDIFLVVAKMDKTDKDFFDKLNDIENTNIKKIIFLT